MWAIWLLVVIFLPGCAMIERITHDPWLSFAFKVLNFAILVAILLKFLSRPVGNFLKNRQVRVRQALEHAERAKADAENRMEEYEKRIAHIDEEIAEIHRILKEEGEREKGKIIAEAERMSEQIKEQARLTAEQELRVAQRVLREELADLVVKVAEEVVRKGLNRSDQKKLFQEYLEKMEIFR